jgi:hypothetical protein
MLRYIWSFSDTAKEVLEYETGESAESLAARLNSLILEKRALFTCGS